MLLKSFGDVDAYPILVDERDPDPSWTPWQASPAGSAASTWRTSRRRAASRSRASCGSAWTSPCSTTTSTAPRCRAGRADERRRGRRAGARRPAGRRAGRRRGRGGDRQPAHGPPASRTSCPVDIDGIVEASAGRGLDPIRAGRQADQPARADRRPGGRARGADVFIGVSGPDSLSLELVRTHGRRPDRVRDGQPHARRSTPTSPAGHVAVMATGRSDFPNQINNVLAFPGIFRGLLDAAATDRHRRDEGRRRARPSPRSSARTSPRLRRALPLRPLAWCRWSPTRSRATARQQGHVRPGSRGSLSPSRQAAEHDAAQRAIQRAVARRFDDRPAESRIARGGRPSRQALTGVAQDRRTAVARDPPGSAPSRPARISRSSSARPRGRRPARARRAWSSCVAGGCRP
jgi:malate dehydrogenase (oxaloacetate-decarboxylating)